MNVTSASFFTGDDRRTLARYQDPSENLADTSSPDFGTCGVDDVAERWCIEKSCMSFSRDAMPGDIVMSNNQWTEKGSLPSVFKICTEKLRPARVRTSLMMISMYSVFNASAAPAWLSAAASASSASASKSFHSYRSVLVSRRMMQNSVRTPILLRFACSYRQAQGSEL